MLQDYDTSVKALSQTIENDQAIVPRILRLVNSSFFGVRSKIMNIAHAIVILGFNTVRNAVVSVSIIDAFSSKDTFEGFDIADFWVHSVAVAVTNRHLAENTRLHCPEEAFTAGLLHDIGKLVLTQYFPDLFKKAWTAAGKNDLSLFEAEKQELAVTHPQIGAYMTKKWQLPGSLVDAVKFHHQPNTNANDINMVMITHAANLIVNHYMVESRKKPDFSGIHSEVLKVMKPQLAAVAGWFPGVSQEIQSACQFFLGGLNNEQ
jgi:putative nucleotidyltransferase with HDIG domain